MPTINTVVSVASSTATHMRPRLFASSARFIANISVWYIAWEKRRRRERHEQDGGEGERARIAHWLAFADPLLRGSRTGGRRKGFTAAPRGAHAGGGCRPSRSARGYGTGRCRRRSAR